MLDPLKMTVTIAVQSYDSDVKAKREAVASRVVQAFASKLPDMNLLAFFDDEDWEVIRNQYGPDNRGGYFPIIRDQPDRFLPPRMNSLIFVGEQRRVFDHGIYLHGSTCVDETSLIMTFAHELQHFVQFGFSRELWAVGRLIPHLPKEVFEPTGLGMNWSDIPHEREARIVAKQVGIQLCGEEVIRRYIDRRIDDRVTIRDVEDWQFIQQLDPSTPYALPDETKKVFKRLKQYRPELENRLQKMKGYGYPGYQDIDLSIYFDDEETP
jgi:hypothetical protein